MSAQQQHELRASPEELATWLTGDVQYIADWLPTEVKQAPQDERIDLCTVERIGTLWACFAGVRDCVTGDAIKEFVVRVGMDVQGSEEPLEYSREFGLSFQTLRKPGPLMDLDGRNPRQVLQEDYRVDDVSYAAYCLRRAFTERYVQQEIEPAVVVQLDHYRQD